jgi:hypothetical protein
MRIVKRRAVISRSGFPDIGILEPGFPKSICVGESVNVGDADELNRSGRTDACPFSEF